MSALSQRSRAWLLGGAALAALGAAPSAGAAVYGVSVGIDDYRYISDLEGAVNDATDIAATLRQRGGDVILLTNEQATRSGIVGAVRAQIAKAVPGDVLVFSYAGHGVQFNEALIGDEVDGKDENFVLHGFNQAGPGAGERLRDNDVASLLQEVEEGVSVLFVADSCHSGTMTRGPFGDATLGKTRWLDMGPLEDDPLPLPDASTFQVEAGDLAHVVFAAAARDEEQTPEILVDGERRGALSWSVARAIEGAADGGDGATSLGDFREFVRAQVRALSGARQTPDVDFDGRGEAALGVARLMSAEGAARDQLEEPDRGPALAAGPAPTLYIDGGPGADALWEQATPVDAESEATLVWRVAEGRLIDRISADLIAEISSAEDAADAVRKWRAVAGLARWAPRRAFDVVTREGDSRHAVGEQVRFRFTAPETGPAEGRLTLFNLASTGEVQYVYPGPGAVASGSDLLRRGDATRELGPSVVSDPVGADHLISVYSGADADALRADLRALDGSRAPEAALAALERHASDPTRARVAVLPLFSVRP